MAAIELYSTPLFNDASLENYYRCENVNDSSSKGRNLTATGSISYSAAKFNNGAVATWNASNYLDGATFSVGTGDFTLGCWFKAASPSTKDYEPHILCIDGGAAVPRIGLQTAKTTGYLGLVTYNSAAVSTSAWSTSNVCDNSLHFVVGTRNGTTVRVYLDGNEVGTGTNTVRDVSSNRVRFGTNLPGGGFDYLNMSATIDDVFVFSRALTPIEISKLYSGIWNSSGFFNFF